MGVLARGLAALILATGAITAAWPAKTQEAQKPQLVTIATGTPGGVYHPLGAAICRMFHFEERKDGLRCRSRASKGSVVNIAMLREQRFDFGIAQADMEQAAVAGTGLFAVGGPAPELRTVLALHMESFTVVARGDLDLAGFEDLRGKRIGVGQPGSGQYGSKDTLLAAYGLTRADFAGVVELEPISQVDELCAGRLDAAFFFAGHPNGLVQDAAISCGIKLVPISGPEVEQLIRREPFFVDTAIPRGLYRGIGQDTPTLGARCVLLTTAAVPETTVYELVKAVFGHFDDFRLLHPVLAGLTPADLVPRGLAAPLHPGAERYFREAGLLN
jgi:TRAP transporter TAXI family solute receptor